jgi:hypothetical protein
MSTPMSYTSNTLRQGMQSNYKRNLMLKKKLEEKRCLNTYLHNVFSILFYMQRFLD